MTRDTRTHTVSLAERINRLWEDEACAYVQFI